MWPNLFAFEEAMVSMRREEGVIHEREIARGLSVLCQTGPIIVSSLRSPTIRCDIQSTFRQDFPGECFPEVTAWTGIRTQVCSGTSVPCLKLVYHTER